MPKMTASSVVLRKDRRLSSFTLVELLFVMAIIIILASLMLFAGSGVIQKAKRSRASGEIQALSTALEGYKTDNGIYPPSEGVLLGTNTPYQSLDGTSTAYQTNSQILYEALSGQTNYNDTHAVGVKAYISFKITQVGNYTNAAGTTGSGVSYVRDPWGYSYGYSTGTIIGTTTNYPYNGNGFFDLWSTGGLLTANVNTNAWISNWQ